MAVLSLEERGKEQLYATRIGQQLSERVPMWEGGD